MTRVERRPRYGIRMEFLSSQRRRRVLSGLVGLVAPLAGCAGGSTTTTTAERERADRDVRLIGHRGCADQYPENTILAVQGSAPHVDMVEVDVQRCGSGELVVFHDDRLDRLTDASGPVRTTNWAELRELTILGSEETIPRLSDLLAAVPVGTGVNVELKHDGMAEDVLSASDGVDNEILFSSFSPTALGELREQDDDVPLAFIFTNSPETSRSIATDLGCVAVHPDKQLVFETDVVENAHDDGFDVNAWTVEDHETATRLVDEGVDGLFVDDWTVL